MLKLRWATVSKVELGWLDFAIVTYSIIIRCNYLCAPNSVYSNLEHGIEPATQQSCNL